MSLINGSMQGVEDAVKDIKIRALMLMFLLALLIAFAGAGCDPGPIVTEYILEDEPNGLPEDDSALPVPDEPEPDEAEDPADEPAGTPSTYYWPWLSYGHLDLSTGEIIAGPDLLRSEPGFTTEFTDQYSYEGMLIWLVEESDVFELEWVALSFNVDYYEDSELAFDFSFELRVDDLQPDPGDEGIQVFSADIVQQEHGFEVAIAELYLGKAQAGTLSAEPVDYVALELKINVVGNP